MRLFYQKSIYLSIYLSIYHALNWQNSPKTMWVSSTPIVTVLMLVVIGLLLSISAASPEARQALPAYVPLSHSYPLRQPRLQQQLQPPTLVEAPTPVTHTTKPVEEDPSISTFAPLGAAAARLRAVAAAAAAKTAYPQRSTPEEAPWLFGAPGRGISKRGAAQLQMRKNSGFLHRDSAPPPKPGGATVLTGTAWHHGSAITPRRCSERGTWSAPLRRCDCGPFAWGADCSVSVVTQAGYLSLHTYYLLHTTYCLPLTPYYLLPTTLLLTRCRS